MAFDLQRHSLHATTGMCAKHVWKLWIRCDAPGCEREGELSPDQLAAHPPGTRLVDLVKRLRCSECGGDVGRAGTLNGLRHARGMA